MAIRQRCLKPSTDAGQAGAGAGAPAIQMGGVRGTWDCPVCGHRNERTASCELCGTEHGATLDSLSSSRNNVETHAKRLAHRMESQHSFWLRHMDTQSRVVFKHYDSAEAKALAQSGDTVLDVVASPGSPTEAGTSAEAGQRSSLLARDAEAEAEAGWVLSLDSKDDILVTSTAEAMRAPAGVDRVRFQQLMHLSTVAFKNKAKWLKAEMAKLRVPWEDGHHGIAVRRATLFQDASAKFLSIAQKASSAGPEEARGRRAAAALQREFRKIWRFTFTGEPGLDAGGLAREFFTLTSAAALNPDIGLFSHSRISNMTYQISPSSGIAVDDHEQYFFFVGLLLGKAVFEGHHVAAPLTRPVLKCLVGQPLSLGDLEFIDDDVYKNLCWVRDNTGVDDAMLDFSVTQEVFGQTKVIELKPGGEDIDVDDDNKDEYIELRVKFRLVTSVLPQLQALTKGFFSVVPSELVSIFDAGEMELLMCGLPNIDMADWWRNTEYRGGYSSRSPQVKWFWEVLERDFSEEQKARLLQFSTGTSRVPVAGFAGLQGRDGDVRKFTIEQIALDVSVYPVAHTCFNRVDLPMYATKADLKRRLMEIAHMHDVTGFTNE